MAFFESMEKKFSDIFYSEIFFSFDRQGEKAKTPRNSQTVHNPILF